MEKKSIEINPEFASEVVLSIPYAYWLHEQGLLEKVSVCKGMKPFYFFCDNVEEKYTHRTLDNSIGLKDTPNKWLHCSDAGDGRAGVVDYSQWKVPPYKSHFQNNLFDHLKPYVVVNNIFNIEGSGFYPEKYFDIQHLYNLFTELNSRGYHVIYKRPDNTEFALDANEESTVHNNVTLTADVEGIGVISDYQLCDYFDNVTNITELQKEHGLDYSTTNLKVFAESSGFISVNGGGYQLCACFDTPTIIYTTRGKELRPMYLEYDDSYINKVRNSKVIPVFDPYNDWEKNGGPDYNKLLNVVKDTFKSQYAEHTI